MSDRVLIIGGGIAGVQAALDAAEAGARVVLVEKSPALGGKMAALDKNFPTLDCSICIEAPKLSEVNDHPNVEVLTNAQVTGLSGEAGAFTATIHRMAGYVTEECTRCDDCVPACPVLKINEFDVGMASRKAIYTPYDQAVPGPYVVDIESCLNDPPNLMPCQRCVEACMPKCIDFLQTSEEDLEREVASVIVATGYDLFNPSGLSEFGYGTHPDILTSLEFERLLNSAGPTGGEIVRPSDGHHPEHILFVLCVGSRDQRYYKYCSRFCCMYSVKHAFQALDHGVDNVTCLYMDLRAYGKGFDGFLDRTRDDGAVYVRGRPSSVLHSGKGLTVRYEDTDRGKIQDLNADMVVLATAVEPPKGLAELTAALGIGLDDDGSLQSVEIGGGLMATTRAGVYAAGCATGPKDIPDSVAEAGAATALALTHLTEHTWVEEEFGEMMPETDEERVGVFVCNCGTNIANVIDVPAVVEYAKTLPGVVHAEASMFSCAGSTQDAIARKIREKRINKLVVAACSPKTHESIFRRVCLKAGLNPFLLEMVNLRNQDSWVHRQEEEEATAKALDMTTMGVQKARLLEPLTISMQPVTQRALVVGGGIAGMTAAANLAENGFETHLVERAPELGGMLRSLDEISPARLDAAELLAGQIKSVADAGVHVHTGAEIEMIGGHIGSFDVRLDNGEEFRAGAVVMATGAKVHEPATFGYGDDPSVITNLELEQVADVDANTVTFVACVGSRHNGDAEAGEAPMGCSRYCCESMIGQALKLRRAGMRVRILYKDIRTFSRHAEEMYEDAMREGVQFFRYDPAKEPHEVISRADGMVTLRDELLGRLVNIPTDKLVLVAGLEPQDEDVSSQLKISKSEDGFLLERHPKLGPVEAGSPGIYMAGTAQGPKDVRESVAQALAAASKAAGLLARDTMEKEPITAKLDEDACTVCSICVRACPFGAIELVGAVKEGSMNFISAACQGCGACSAVCNFDAIVMPYFTDAQIFAQVDAALAEKPEEKVVVFACNWCSYAGADQAGIEKLQYPSSARIIRTMCSARIAEKFVMHAFDKEAGAVLMTGCRLTEQGSDCHYIDANVQTQKRFDVIHRKLKRREIEADRLQLQWVSASEGKQFAAKIGEMDDVVKGRAVPVGEGV
ncbi:MAG: hydrogenase iron-sulfur subunit [Chloroflexota bacterium]|nr:hydrogenase iron-sulfur subunit [Chloroflexota bacterium]